MLKCGFQTGNRMTLPKGIVAVTEHDIPVLVRERLLSPLGKPAPNAPKFFARVVIERLATDVGWLDKASMATAKYWKRKREARGN